MPPTCSMSVSTRTASCPSPCSCRALGLSTDEEILDFFGDDERILATLEKDTTKNQDEGLLEVYRKLRPGEPPTVESATSQIEHAVLRPAPLRPVPVSAAISMNKKLSSGPPDHRP